MKDESNLPGLIGRHPAMREVYRLVRQTAARRDQVLITGETGTGKELVARALHELSPRATGPFMAVNCAAIPETLAEAELFGAERGAYTGAQHRVDGVLTAADHGTLFLDEACSMPHSVQAKLLRALESGEFCRVGSRRTVHADFRLVASVSAPVETLLREGRMRPDLAYRLQGGCEIGVPPLRARASDIPELVQHFLVEVGGGPGVSPDALSLLVKYEWPGNVRQLRAVMRRLQYACDGGVIGLANVAAELPGNGKRSAITTADMKLVVTQLGSVRAAARILGLPRSTLRSRLSSIGSDIGETL